MCSRPEFKCRPQNESYNRLLVITCCLAFSASTVVTGIADIRHQEVNVLAATKIRYLRCSREGQMRQARQKWKAHREAAKYCIFVENSVRTE